ncbi:hypothetical protein [uncultured Jannaschia sp.]|uniref:hypothetical protein n=1 Tax=uncultured Jannaschia sp. TaxID=293347 RepID=UPI0026387A2B|nr:hypothetical protein [uncultured Jannaschia sp.]
MTGYDDVRNMDHGADESRHDRTARLGGALIAVFTILALFLWSVQAPLGYSAAAPSPTDASVLQLAALPQATVPCAAEPRAGGAFGETACAALAAVVAPRDAAASMRATWRQASPVSPRHASRPPSQAPPLPA